MADVAHKRVAACCDGGGTNVGDGARCAFMVMFALRLAVRVRRAVYGLRTAAVCAHMGVP